MTTEMTTLDKIKQQIAENPIILYMKGSPKLPSCGFSAQAVQVLSQCGEPLLMLIFYKILIFVQNYPNLLIGQLFRNYGLKAS